MKILVTDNLILSVYWILCNILICLHHPYGNSKNYIIILNIVPTLILFFSLIPFLKLCVGSLL